MQDFRAVPEGQQQDEMTQSPKTVALLAVAGTAWPYSVGPSVV